MSKLKFLTQCPGCGDTHLGVECKKPSSIVPTVVKVRCDECESSTVFRISLPRNRTDRNQIAYQPTAIVPSAKLLRLIKIREELKAEQEARAVEIPSSDVSPAVPVEIPVDSASTNIS